MLLKTKKIGSTTRIGQTKRASKRKICKKKVVEQGFACDAKELFDSFSKTVNDKTKELIEES